MTNQVAQQQQQVAVKQKSIADSVQAKVKQFQDAGELHFPAGYSPDNAVKSAWLILQSTKTGKDSGYKPALEVCTKDSVANALLDMVVQGLNPMKKQGYFIVYGKQLTFQRSYFGTMAVTKRVTGAKNIDAAVIYEGDEVDYEMKNGRITNLNHKQKFGNIKKENLIGAYCIIELPNNEIYTELMTIDELRKAWSKAQFWGKGEEKEKAGSTHDEFKQEMAKKTVINRACKKFLNSSDDSSLIMDHFHGSDNRNEDAALQAEIYENANSEPIDITPETGLIEEQASSQVTTVQEADYVEVPQQSAQEQQQASFAEGPNF
ncbi:recombinase RecT [Lysinibacillus sp. NPDC093216]|uniref:recombinase RecT n=1 Tax=Lysinibacillus sp. NPDC093216 TaxID=3390576 RepID=UPI003D00C477